MLSRYVRQLMLTEIGEAGQARLAAARVLIIGCGALGSMQAQALARAGVGYLRLIDRDCVDRTNLHRQMLYDETDAASGRHKAEIAADKLARINSEIIIEPHVLEVTTDNLKPFLDNVDLVLDGTDNFATRQVINNLCVRKRLPWIYGGILHTEGLAMAIKPGITACLGCVFPQMPASTTTKEVPQGIFPTAPAIIGAIQATLALRMLLGAPDSGGTLFKLDFWRMRMTQIQMPRIQNCSACSDIW